MIVSSHVDKELVYPYISSIFNKHINTPIEEDIFINNYNKSLLKLHQANIDLQYITDEYAVAEYVCDYCTKVSSPVQA